MNKGQLIEALSGHFEGNKRAAQHALESVVDTITREVAKGEKVAITGFGAFERVARPARMVRNPRTGERSRAKKTAVPRFRAGAELKAVVSGAKKLPKLTPTKAATTAKRSASAASKASASKANASKANASKASTSKAGTSKASASKASASNGAARSSAATKKSATSKSPAKKSSTSKSTASKSTASKSTASKSSGAKKSSAKRS